MNPLIQSLTEGQLRTDITRKLSKELANVSRSLKVWLSLVKVLVSQKLTPFVKSLTVSVLNVLSQSTLHVLTRLKSFVTVKCVALNCTTFVHCKVKRLVSKKSVVNLRKLCHMAEFFSRSP